MGTTTARAVLEAQNAMRPDVIAARATIDGREKIVDLHTPLPEGTPIKPIALDHPDALWVIRHSSSHVMADAVQRLFPGTKVAFGPATENGFYYDYDRPGGSFTEEDLRAIETKMAEIIAEDRPFEREEVTVDQARDILTRLGETYKLEHLERLAAMGEQISIYRHGDWVDLCEGPHVPSTKYLKAFQLTTVAGAYWRGDERNPMLQRIYGTAFANEKALRAYLKQLEEAKKRDHRKLGKELELVGFHPWAPASPFFLPRGASIYAKLVDYVRDLYVRFGYDEVVTPQIFDRELFLTSGHLPAYSENMFLAATRENIEDVIEHLGKEALGNAKDIEKALEEKIRFGIKPMNCPGHCLLYGMQRRSYRELPMRVADFGRLHRFERSGVTQGLTRVRTFCQDDAHIFCTLDQAQGEIESFIDLVYAVYQDFGFAEVRVVIATRPDERLGSDEVWDRAEKALIAGVQAKKLDYSIAEGEGAFYGPKIEFHLKDAIGRSWQLGTMQVDFNLPERFDLTYVGEDNTQHRPVMLHRAILGSIERFMGVLIEHVSGAFPTWLAPEQIALLTVSEKFEPYAREVQQLLTREGFRVKIDLSSDKLGAKIRNARLMRIPFLGVIGEKEVEGRGLAIRSRDEDKDLGFVALDQVIARLRHESRPPSLRPSPAGE
ncbi:threonine--tRNA ligase [Sandaracinus amylolyticus]|nr:threonine--tRNA ligase [Sandaracinus amylolyticus]